MWKVPYVKPSGEVRNPEDLDIPLYQRLGSDDAATTALPQRPDSKLAVAWKEGGYEITTSYRPVFDRKKIVVGLVVPPAIVGWLFRDALRDRLPGGTRDALLLGRRGRASSSPSSRACSSPRRCGAASTGLPRSGSRPTESASAESPCRCGRSRRSNASEERPAASSQTIASSRSTRTSASAPSTSGCTTSFAGSSSRRGNGRPSSDSDRSRPPSLSLARRLYFGLHFSPSRRNSSV